MTVKDLKKELESYDDDTEIVFKVCDYFEPDSITNYKSGHQEVRIDARVKLLLICDIYGVIHMAFVKDDE